MQAKTGYDHLKNKGGTLNAAGSDPFDNDPRLESRSLQAAAVLLQKNRNCSVVNFSRLGGVAKSPANFFRSTLRLVSVNLANCDLIANVNALTDWVLVPERLVASPDPMTRAFYSLQGAMPLQKEYEARDFRDEGYTKEERQKLRLCY